MGYAGYIVTCIPQVTSVTRHALAHFVLGVEAWRDVWRYRSIANGSTCPVPFGPKNVGRSVPFRLENVGRKQF